MNINANNTNKLKFTGKEEKKVSSKKKSVSSQNQDAMNKTIEDMAQQKAEVNKLAVKSSKMSKTDLDYINLRDKFCTEL